ncbi:hypothetical protein pb186bvf_020652 [Paramecium bursaria]
MWGTYYQDDQKQRQQEIKFLFLRLDNHLGSRIKQEWGCTTNKGPNKNNSDCFISLSSLWKRLNQKHTIVRQLMKGIDVLIIMYQTFVDDNNRPLLNTKGQSIERNNQIQQHQQISGSTQIPPQPIKQDI